MDGVDDQRRERGRHFGLEVLACFFLLTRGELAPRAQEDSVLGETGDDDMAIAFRLALKRAHQLFADLLQQGLLGVGCPVAKDGFALHEEFVEIGSKDGEELCPFQQRRALIQRLGEDALVEVQPAQIPIQPHRLQPGGQAMHSERHGRQWTPKL